MMVKSNDSWQEFWEEAAESQDKKTGRFFIKPVSPEVFFRDWINTPLFPRQLKWINSAFNKNYTMLSDQFNEMVIAAGKGSGKDMSISNLLAYIMYFLLCMNNPQKELGLPTDEPIDVVNVAFDGDQAKQVFFEKFVRVVKKTINPETGENFFEEQGMNIERSITRNSIIFPKNIRAWSANSKEYKNEGKNILLAICDEIAQFRFDHAESIRKHLKTSAKTRFPQHYKIIYISFLTSPNDFMAYLIDKAESGEMSRVFFDRASTWDVRSEKNCPKELIRYTISKDLYQEDYDEDPANAMLMYECKIPKFRSNNFIKRADRITDCVNYNKPSPVIFPDENYQGLKTPRFWTHNIQEEELEHWFRPNHTYEIESLEREYENSPSQDLENLIKLEKERHSSCQYHVHIDLSRGVVDCAGITMAHSYHILDKTKIYIDFMLQVRAPLSEDGSPKEIDLTHILDFVIKELYKKRRFNIIKVTADGWNSQLFLNLCEKESIEAETISLEKNTDPYETLKDYIYRKDISYYFYPPAIRELTELVINDKKKVDHPRKSKWRSREEGLNLGSKDISDCLAGCVASITKDSDGEPVAMAGK